ncbi:MAG: hypothetical protein LBR50_01425 [Tannerella sp.]|jgi:tetratricopeptide (TPR) repeat protein|nr:hypothetical protein [Tannerella sp.]
MNEIDLLIQRFEEMSENGSNMYFDADEIVELLDNYDIMENYEMFEKALALGQKLHPENNDIRIRSYRVLIQNELYDEALRNILNTPDDEDGILEMMKVECLCLMERYDDVRNILHEKIASGDEDAVDLYEYAVCVMSGEKCDKKVLNEFVDEGLALFPGNISLTEEHCYLLESQGYIVKAIELCNEMLDRDPYFSDYWYMSGRLHAVLGQYDKAVEALDFAITCDEEDLEIKLFRAYCLYKNDDFDKAVDEFRDLFDEVDAEETNEIIDTILEEYPVQDDFKEICHLFDVLRDENIMDFLPPELIEQIAEQMDEDAPAGEIQVVKVNKDNIAGTIKFYLSCPSNDGTGLIEYLRSKGMYPEQHKAISSKQLTKNYLKEKYHGN